MADTQYYKLQQETPAGGPNHAALNENLGKLDAALHAVKAAGDGNLSTMRGELAAAKSALSSATAAKCQICTGVYLGNGAETRFISLPFTPTAILLENEYGDRNHGDRRVTGGLVTTHRNLFSGGTCAMALKPGGFEVYYYENAGAHTNKAGDYYSYIAFK